MKEIHTGVVWQELQPVERTHVVKACGRSSSVGGNLSLEHEESKRSAPPEEE